jgi:glucosamine-6-phosphate deaminase
VKVVDLDETCRMQQVHDGCFATLDDVPKYALTLTVPTLANAPYRFCVVPAKTKAQAVRNTVEGEIGEACPATALRRHANAVLYLDPDSSALL